MVTGYQRYRQLFSSLDTTLISTKYLADMVFQMVPFENSLLKIEDSKIKETSFARKENPYLTKTLYIATALKKQIFNGANVAFLFDDSFYFTNKDVKDNIYEMDFDDGNGFRKIQFGQTIHISYSDIGMKTLKLRKIEKNNMDHDTRLYVSFDSPEKGANIPLGIQFWAKFFAQMHRTVNKMYNNMLCCPAARQMLIYHSEYFPDPTNNPYRIAFLENKTETVKILKR